MLPANGSGNGRVRGLLADAIEALTEGFALFGPDGKLVLCNARFRETNPRIAELIVPGVAYDLLLREAVARGAIDEATCRRLDWIESRLDAGAPPETLEFETPTSRVLSATLAATKQGGFVVTLRDVTARRRIAMQEREEDEILRQVLGACPASVFMARLADGQVLYRSPAMIDLVGPIRSARDLFASREERADFITALMPNGRVDAMPVTCRHVGGAEFPGAISARLIEHRGEDVVVAALVDRTQEFRMRAELAAQRETIFQNEKMSALGELLAGVAHELNNPLSVVVGHAMMLREESADPDTLRRIDKISQAAERCARIVRSFLAMARQEPAQLAAIDLNAAVATGLDAVRHGPAGVAARVECALARDLPPVMADADQIAQVVVNLVANADQAIADAGRGDRIRVETRRHGDAVALVVADNGPGVPEALRGRIFEPFFTTKDVGEGTGLGLALCHRIATSHGGRIRVDAVPGGGGAAFIVELPVATVRRHAPEAPAEAAGAAPARVLVVEDEAEVAALIGEILARAGFEVVHASSGEAALARLADGGFAAVLSDLAMPGLGGRGFYEALERDHPEIARRTAFVTGDAMGPAARAFLDGSGRPCLEKPIAPGELRALVRRLLAESR